LSDPTLVYNAIKMYRNYDGRLATFGDVSVRTMTPAPDSLSAFAAVRSSDAALTLVVINKQSNAGANLSVNLTNFSSAISSQVWQMTSSNVIARLPDVNLRGNVLATSVPP
jgi:alpha-L-arabinofuranosidase